MIPTKPIRPLTATAAAVPTVAAATIIRRTRRDVDRRALPASSSPEREHVEHAAVREQVRRR